jgi:hypothetical protein
MFKGVSEYLDELMTRINAPLLQSLDITLFHQLIFDTPQLTQFIGRTPKLKAYDEARVYFFNRCVHVVLKSDGVLDLKISCGTVRLAAFVSGAGLQLVLPSAPHPCGGTPLHLWGVFTTTVAG